jgi:hypothetical protein
VVDRGRTRRALLTARRGRLRPSDIFHPAASGSRTVRVEVFVDDPDSFVERAVTAGADGSVDQNPDHHALWGVHRQGGFLDPFGQL